MGEANRDEAQKCKTVAQTAMDNGDTEKAVRFLQKAKRMAPSDRSIDELLMKAQANGGSASAGGGSPPSGRSSTEAPRYRQTASTGSPGAASSASRVNKDGGTYTSEQMQLVQRILRTKDYYDILELPRDADEDAVKKAYRKLALKLHPDKNRAPGADEAFKKLSKAVQCLQDAEKKEMYNRYGDDEQMPQQHRQHYQQDFMSPEDLFAAFFGGGTFQTRFHHQTQRRPGEGAAPQGNPQGQAALFQLLPVLLLVVLTLLSNFATQDNRARFSFTENSQYHNPRSTPGIGVKYFVTDQFEDAYPEGTRNLAEFDQQVEVFHIRNLQSDCDYQEQVMYKKVLQAKRKGSTDDIKAARNYPRAACKELEKIKSKHNKLYRLAMYGGMR